MELVEQIGHVTDLLAPLMILTLAVGPNGVPQLGQRDARSLGGRPRSSETALDQKVWAADALSEEGR